MNGKDQKEVTLTTPLLSEDANSSTVSLPQETEPKYDLVKIIFSLWLGSFLSALDSTVVASTMSGIASEFNDSGHLTWIATSYMLTNTAFQPLYGKTSDILGRKICLVFAQLWFGLGCLLCCFSQNLTQFAIARAIAGVGGGGLSSLSSIVVSDIVTLQDRGIYQGYANLMYATAQAMGGPIGGLFMQTIGWRWMFGIQAPLTVICMFLAVKYVNIHSSHFPKLEDRFKMENIMRIDFFGSGSLVIATSSFLFLLSGDNEAKSNWICFIVFVISFLGFIFIENKVSKEPVIPPHLFQGILGLTAFIASFGMFVSTNLLFLVPLYLEVVQDVSPSGAGAYMISQVLAAAVGSLYAGSYLRGTNTTTTMSEEETNKLIRKKSGHMVVYSVILELIGIVMVQIDAAVTEPNNTDKFLWKIFIPLGLGICGFGIGMLLVTLLVLAVAIVGKQGQAAASSMNYLFRSVGQVVGVSGPLFVYNKALYKGLSDYLSDKPDGENILKKLLKDNNWLRHGLSDDLKEGVFQIYRNSISELFIVGAVAAVIGIVLAISLVMRKRL